METTALPLVLRENRVLALPDDVAGLEDPVLGSFRPAPDRGRFRNRLAKSSYRMARKGYWRPSGSPGNRRDFS